MKVTIIIMVTIITRSRVGLKNHAVREKIKNIENK